MNRREFLAGGVALGAAGLAGTPALAAGADYAGLDATDQAALVRSRQIAAAELVEAAILRLERFDPALNVLVTPCYERALAIARRSLGTGPFAGVPFLVKDVSDLEGVRRTSGSRALAAEVAGRTGDYVRAMEEAGLVALGKSTTPEFALIPNTAPLLTGATRNPWNPSRSVAGSSGGSAAAVAAGLVPIAHATDGGGSIRNPASACGLFGFKASNGRLVGSSGRGATGALGVNGCVSRSVRDAAALLAATERQDVGAAWPAIGTVTGPSKRRLRIALSTRNLYGRDAEPAVRRAILATARLCELLGHRVEEAAPAIDGEKFLRHFTVIYGMGAAGPVDAFRQAHGRMPDERDMEPFTLIMAERHRAHSSGAVPAALAYLQKAETVVDAFLARYDATLTPTLRQPPPPMGYIDPSGPYDRTLDRVIDYASYTPLHNAVSVPAMSVPLGWTADGLPIGSHFAARMGAERTLLELAYELEQSRPWHGRTPVISA